MIYYRKQYFDSVVGYGIFDEATIDKDGGVTTEEYVISFASHSDHVEYRLDSAYLYDYEVAHMMLVDHYNGTNLQALTHGEYCTAIAQLQEFDELHMKAQDILLKMMRYKNNEIKEAAE